MGAWGRLEVVRRAAKVDSNQSSIVEDLRLIPGCSVLVLSSVGKGCPDILVGYRGANLLFEIKNEETLRGEKPETIARQKTFRDSWCGQVQRVTSFLQIVDYMTGLGLMERE